MSPAKSNRVVKITADMKSLAHAIQQGTVEVWNDCRPGKNRVYATGIDAKLFDMATFQLLFNQNFLRMRLPRKLSHEDIGRYEVINANGLM